LVKQAPLTIFTTLIKYINNMGFFSWLTQDTDESIANNYSNNPVFTVFMRDNNGNIWKEDNYEGYGVFGGKDFYELLAEMNGLGDDRSAGITLVYSGNEYLSPNLNRDETIEWTNSEPETCPYQGYFYPNDEVGDDYDWDAENDEVEW
jgi:hypothetical protein